MVDEGLRSSVSGNKKTVQVQAIIRRGPIPRSDVASVREPGRWLLFPCKERAFDLLNALELDWIYEGSVPIFAVVEDEYSVEVFDNLFDAGLIITPGDTPAHLSI
jgi:hypothetical protein